MSTPRGIHTAPIPEWTVREQLVLASAVQRSGDQNWVSVSRAVRPLIEDAHPPEYFSQKNCALQYSSMLDKASTPKRKRSSDGTPEAAETAEEQIVRQLTEKRISELNESLAEIKAEYLSLKREIEQIERGELDSQLPAIWEQIQMEIAAKEEAEAKAKEAAAAPVKVRSPTGNQARQHEQPKPRAHKMSPSHPQEVGMARAAEAERVKRAERAEQRQKDVGLTAVAKSGGKQNVAELKLPLEVKTEAIAAPALSHPKLATPPEDDTVSDEAPLPKLISTPKEEKYRIPMHVPQPSTEASLQQLSSDIHIIVQQPNTAMSRVGVAPLPLTTVSNSKSTTGTGVPSSSPQFAVAKIEHIQSPPPTSQPLKMASTVKILSVNPLPMSPEVKLPLLPRPTERPAATPGNSRPKESKLPTVARTVPPGVPDTQQGTVPSTQPPLPAPLTQPPPPVPSTQPPLTVPSAQPPCPTPSAQPPPPVPSTQPPLPIPSTQPPLPVFSTQPPPPAPSTHLPPSTSKGEAKLFPATQPLASSTPTVATSATVHVLANVTTSTTPPPPAPPPPAPPPMPSSPPRTTLPPAPPPLIPTPPSKESKLQSAKEQTAAVSPASKVSPGSLPQPVVQPRDSSRPVDRGAPPLEDKEREGGEKMMEEDVKSAVATQQTEEQKVTREHAAKSEGTTKDVPGESIVQEEPMELEKPLEAKPPAPPSKQEKPLSPKPPALPPPPPLTPTIVVSEAKSSRSGVRSPKSPLSPTTRVTRTRSNRKEAGTAEMTERQQTQQREAATPVEPKSPPSLKQEKLAPATREEKKLAPATSREEKKLAPATPREEKKLAPATPREEKKLAPATPREEKKLASTAPKEEKKVAPTIPREEKKLAPATPREEKKLAPSTTKEEKKLAPVAPREEKKLAPATPREEKKLAPATPKEEKKLAPATREEKKLVPATPREEKKLAPATPREEKKLAPATPREEKKLAPATPREEKKLVPATPREEKKLAPATPREEKKLAPATPREEEEDEEEEEEEEETPIRTKKSYKAPFKKQWITRSRKRKADVLEEGPSVESTDLESEEEPMSSQPSAVPSPAPSQSDMDQESALSQKQWRKAIMLVWRHAAQHKYANLFLHPVKEDDAPGYREVIFRPMDLSTIKKNVETGVTRTDTEFQRDMLLMFQNAFMYNSSDHAVHQMADEMRTDVMENIQDYLATQMQLMVETAGTKVLRSGGRREFHDESIFSPAKKRRTRADDVAS